MEKTKFYDEAINNFYRNKEINSYPLSSLDIYAQHFGKVCKNLQDVKNLSDLAQKEKWENEMPFRNEIMDKEHVVVVTDANLNIVYASQNMFQMNGYESDEVIGKKPKMFQGKETCVETTKQVSNAIKNNDPFEVVLLNYRKNGSPYKCWIQGSPVFDKAGKVVNFIAFEKEVA
ncbi:PAS domain-containing protein [Allomuricauda sp. R78024]|uniref:PAS domain-containing protein n=1 Tax=Allomuricauda sp. R78024 TaxID=3093867 RepID=UPI0037C5F9E1